MRVVIVDDSAIFRSALAAYLAQWKSIAVVGSADTGLESLAVVERTRPDLVLMDLVMPEMDGLTAVRELRRRGVGARIMTVTMHDALEYRGQAIAAGADAFVSKKNFHDSFEAYVRSWFGISTTNCETDPPEGPPTSGTEGPG